MKSIYRAIIHTVCQSVWVTEKGYTPHIVINPHAGTLKNRKKRSLVSEAIYETLGTSDISLESYKYHLYITEFAQHAFEISKQIIDIVQRSKDKKHLVVIAAGDGTAHEILSNFIYYEKILKRVVFFRLPFGTGNDASDCDNIYQAMQVQSGYGKITTQKVLCVTTAQGKSIQSFNIASVGLDAYVVQMTNRLKNAIPGSFYSLFVDISTLLYEPLFKPEEMRIRVVGDRIETHYDGTYLFIAMGVSGFRTYGDHKSILPDNNNLCLCKPIPLIQKLLKKRYFYDGRHKNLANVTMARGQKMIIEYNKNLPFQSDGEDYLFVAEDFPLTFELLDIDFHVIKHHQSL